MWVNGLRGRQRTKARSPPVAPFEPDHRKGRMSTIDDIQEAFWYRFAKRASWGAMKVVSAVPDCRADWHVRAPDAKSAAGGRQSSPVRRRGFQRLPPSCHLGHEILELAGGRARNIGKIAERHPKRMAELVPHPEAQ